MKKPPPSHCEVMVLRGIVHPASRLGILIEGAIGRPQDAVGLIVLDDFLDQVAGQDLNRWTVTRHQASQFTGPN